MFQARSMSRSPADRCSLRSAPRLSEVTRFFTKVTPCSVQGFRAAASGSKSMMVMRFGSTSMCRSRTGSVHRATAPKPTNKIRWENGGILCEVTLSLELFHQHLGVPAALFVLLPPCRREIVRGAFQKPPFGLKIGKGLRRERQEFPKTQFTRPVFHELDQFAPNPLVLMRRAHIQTRQLRLVLLGIHVEGDAGEGILVDFEDEVIAEAL